QRLFRDQDLGPGQPRAAVEKADDEGRALRRHQEHVAGQLVQVDMAEFADLVLDNATFFLAHGRGAAVQLMALEDPIDGRRRRYRIAPLAQGGVDLIAVHAPLAAGDDLGLDALRLTALPPFRPAAL